LESARIPGMAHFLKSLAMTIRACQILAALSTGLLHLSYHVRLSLSTDPTSQLTYRATFF